MELNSDFEPLRVLLSVQQMKSVRPMNAKEAGGAAERWNERPPTSASLRVLGLLVANQHFSLF